MSLGDYPYPISDTDYSPELMIHRAVDEGVAPPLFTWTELYYDIFIGITALLLAPFAATGPKPLLWAWNLMGLALLENVVTVAILSVPGPLQVLPPQNTWVADLSFVWLPRSAC